MPSAEAAVEVYAAGSLQAALTELAEAWRKHCGIAIRPTWGPSGLLRARIEAGERPDLFASANLTHPRALAALGIGGPVATFARNRLCALTRPGLGPAPEALLDLLLDPRVGLGTATPGADPSGDYAWQLFAKAEQLRPGSFAPLARKARPLTGGPDVPDPPAGRNRYAWVLTERRADVFLTYRTNALLARRDSPELVLVDLPAELAVGTDYGLTVLTPEQPAATALAAFLRAHAGQAILAEHGFDPPAREGFGVPTS